MTDFVADLEAELLAAARRRASARRRLPRLPLRPILGLATVAAALDRRLVLIARPAPDSRSADHAGRRRSPSPLADGRRRARRAGRSDRSPPPRRSSTSWCCCADARVRGAAPAERCAANGTQPFGTWLPVGAVALGSERMPLDTSKLYVLPTADVRTRADRAAAPTDEPAVRARA